MEPVVIFVQPAAMRIIWVALLLNMMGVGGFVAQLVKDGVTIEILHVQPAMALEMCQFKQQE
jgi:hypothetical protein